MTEPNVRKPWYQLLPEETVFEDTGCDLSPSCLRCHLARCAEDHPRARQRLRQLATIAAVQQLLAVGHTQAQISRMLRLSVRTVNRYKNTYPPRKETRQTKGTFQPPNEKGGNACRKQRSQRDTRSAVSST